MPWLEKRDLPGIIDLTPGIRSLQVHYDSRVLPLDELLSTAGRRPNDAGRDRRHAGADPHRRICRCPGTTPRLNSPSRKYMQSVRADAPWCPSNIEFIRRINGLDSIDEVKRIVFDASYLVLGLGDVYLGAPVATPLDPRHRLVTTKYNPARTWTPENAVGIGGAYLCIYGMEGPGGYQFVGRTCQIWNTYQATGPSRRGQPWLLRFFDQIRFYPVIGAGTAGFSRRFPARPRAASTSARKFSAAAIIVDSSRKTAEASPRTKRASKPPSKPSASGGRHRPERLYGGFTG